MTSFKKTSLPVLSSLDMDDSSLSKIPSPPKVALSRNHSHTSIRNQYILNLGIKSQRVKRKPTCTFEMELKGPSVEKTKKKNFFKAFAEWYAGPITEKTFEEGERHSSEDDEEDFRNDG